MIALAFYVMFVIIGLTTWHDGLQVAALIALLMIIRSLREITLRHLAKSR